MALPVPGWPRFAFAGVAGKLDEVRQRRRRRFQGIQEAQLASWQREAGRKWLPRVMILPRWIRISDDRYPHFEARSQDKQYLQACDLAHQNQLDLSKRR